MDIDGTITENGNGMINLGALGILRGLAAAGHRIIYVTGRSSVEAFVLSVFGGTGSVAVGENGGCITTGPATHIQLGDIVQCRMARRILQKTVSGVCDKPVFPRMTEVVLNRTFDIDRGRDILQAEAPDTVLSDSGYAYHINSKGIDKGRGLQEIITMYGIQQDDIIAIGDSRTDVPMFRIAGTSVALGNADEWVRSQATIQTDADRGDGVVEAIQTIMPSVVET